MPTFPKVLLTGANGQLASAIKTSAPESVEVIALTRQQLNICDAHAVRQSITHYSPDCVINGAAYNLVDKAETDEVSDAFQINAIGVAHLACLCKENAISLVHFSTDFVFDGQKRTPYVETDSAIPISVYGASKLAGENVALSASDANFVIRVCRLFGPVELKENVAGQKPTGNFPLTMLKLAATHSQLRVVNDQIGSPTYTPDLAKAIWQLLEKGSGGVFHLSNSSEVAFDEYARTIFEIAKIDCEVIGINSAEYNAPAKRPSYSTLSNAKAQSFGISPLRSWREALEDYLQTDDV
ncbi:MAG: dTDP-4-dehydrorhamnose reductase [Abditibacteriaceae bacterium]